MMLIKGLKDPKSFFDYKNKLKDLNTEGAGS